MQPKDESPVASGRVFNVLSFGVPSQVTKDVLPPFTPWGEAQYQATAKFIAARDVLVAICSIQHGIFLWPCL